MIATVKITPIGTNKTFDATDYLAGNSAISKIVNSIDNSDFVVGVFSYAFTDIKLVNRDGLFSANDPNTIFNNGRDNSRVEISLLDQESNKASIIFKGNISDNATKEDVLNEVITFTVLSSDSIFKRFNVPFGILKSGISFKDAIVSLLDRNVIRNFLTIDSANIFLDYNGVVENGEALSGLSMQNAINAILVAANSIMYVDQKNVVHVTTRTRIGKIKKRFYGPFDVLGRSPQVLKIKDLNNGLHRTINKVTINKEFYLDSTYVGLYSLREKKLDFDFISSVQQLARIANNLIIKYREPRMEMTIEVKTVDALNLNLTDIVTVDWPKKAVTDSSIESRYGRAKYGQGRYAGESGGFYLRGDIGFIIYQKTDILSNFRTELKLREFGHQLGDSNTFARESDYGTARYGKEVYAEDNPVYVDTAAKYGSGKYGIHTYG